MCPTQVQSIKITQGPCDAQGNVQVTAEAVLATGVVVGSYSWGFDNGTAVPGGQTSPAQTFAGGSMHSVQLAAMTGGCLQLLVELHGQDLRDVAATTTAATATTAPITTAAATTAAAPITTAAATTTTAAAAATTAAAAAAATTDDDTDVESLRRLTGPALILLAIASVGLAVGGCLGPAGVGIMLTATGIGAVGLIVFALWIAFCGNCALMRFLQRFFGAMALLMLGLSALLALFGMLPCSVGAAAVATLFGAMVGVLSVGIAILRCP